MAPSKESTSAIYTKGCVWAKLVEQVKHESKQNTSESASKPDAYLFIVGDRSSGKTTLLNSFLKPSTQDHKDKSSSSSQVKPTEGLDYTFARKTGTSMANVERKDVANIWEVSGTETFKKEVSQAESLFITPRQVATATVLIVVDLSKPWLVLSSLVEWLGRVRSRLDDVYDKFTRRGSKIPTQLKARAKKAFGSNREDQDQIDHSGISIVIVANKYDCFCDEDAELRKIMARTLRYVAHTNGATLIYTSNKSSVGKGGGGSSEGSKDSRNTLNNLRHVLNHYLFTGADRRLPAKGAVQSDHLQALFMPGGSDHLRDIGRPKGSGGESGGSSGLDEWRRVFDRYFTPPQGAERKELEDDTDLDRKKEFAEDEIDSMREQKLRELEEYRRQVKLEQQQSKKRASVLGSRKQSVSGSQGSTKKASAVRRSSVF